MIFLHHIVTHPGFDPTLLQIVVIFGIGTVLDAGAVEDVVQRLRHTVHSGIGVKTVEAEAFSVLFMDIFQHRRIEAVEDHFLIHAIPLQQRHALVHAFPAALLVARFPVFLDFQIQRHTAVFQQGQQFFQQRNGLWTVHRTGIQGAQLGQRHIRHSAGAVGGAVHRFVVDQHQSTVLRHTHIRLDHVHAHSDRRMERLHGVFRIAALVAPVAGHHHLSCICQFHYCSSLLVLAFL